MLWINVNKKYELHALEIAIDMLNSKRFSESTMGAKEFLLLVRTELLSKKEIDKVNTI